MTFDEELDARAEEVATEPDALPPAPEPVVLDPDDRHTILRDRVTNALVALPGYFEFESPFAGINATDLFNLNTLLGAAIELEVVRTLNRLREIWDPDSEWVGYRFERSSQAFPDVRLVRRDVGAVDIAIGIELKGWYLLAKEGVPSLRYAIAPAACAPHDLVCVVPWYLSNAVSGTPVVVEPWIEGARHAAEWRDYWWEYIRVSDDADRTVSYPTDAHPYPAKAELASAIPAHDGGGNFGRLPRCKPLMDEFIERTGMHEILGIAAINWLRFLRLHTDTATHDEINEALGRMLKKPLKARAEHAAGEILESIRELSRFEL